MTRHIAFIARGERNPIQNGLKRFLKLLTCLALAPLFCACTGMIADGLEWENAVCFPMRSPEYVARNLGNNRYLLEQWNQPLNANQKLTTRFYDRNTGTLSPVPAHVLTYRGEGNSVTLGALRYESDSPQQIVFFSVFDPPYYVPYGCRRPDESATGKPVEQQCGLLEIVLSLDGGHSFARRRVNAPNIVSHLQSSKHFEFAIVRNNILYLGLYVQYSCEKGCDYSADRTRVVDSNGAALTVRFEGDAIAERHDVFLSVLTVSLPSNGGNPLPAEEIPRNLTAEMLQGQALLAFDLGKPMSRWETPRTAPRPPGCHYQRADRKAYIESLRAEYPEWATHQTLNDIPWRRQWMSSRELNALREKQTPRGNDPVGWVRFDRESPRFDY